MNDATLSGSTAVVIDRALVSALGDTITACAAARAGIVRARDLVLQLDVAARAESDPPFVGHAADSIARGFDGQGRLLRLISAALRELADRGTIEGGVDLYLAVPNPQRVAQSLALVRDASERQRIASTLQEGEKAPPRIDLMRRFVNEVRRVSRCSAELRLARVFGTGHTAMLEALGAAVADLEEGRVRSALVGGVDSHVTSRALAMLKSTGRLKTGTQPVGLLPGEAGCFVVLERWDEARRRDRQSVLASVERVAVAQASHSFLESSPSDGRVLAATLIDAGTPKGQAPVRVPWFVADLNGEEYRASEWGEALVHLTRTAQLGWSDQRAVAPAVHHGDTGAASGGVGLLTALHAFWRRAAPSAFAIVSSCSDGRTRAAALLRDLAPVERGPHG
jgi:3-oxoacyl-[acyl-carrier-protein] synthase-1